MFSTQASLEGNIKCGHGRTGHSRKRDWARLGHVPRSARTIDRKHDEVAPLQLAFQSKQSGSASAAAGSAHGNEPKFFDGSRDVFAIKAAADHDGDADLSPEPRARKNSAVPEGIDHRFFVERARDGGWLFPRNGISQRRPDQGDCRIGGPTNQPKKNSFAQRESASVENGRVVQARPRRKKNSRRHCSGRRITCCEIAQSGKRRVEMAGSTLPGTRRSTLSGAAVAHRWNQSALQKSYSLSSRSRFRAPRRAAA